MTIRAHSIDIENLTLAQRLSDFVCQTEYEDLPAHVREEARRVFANAVCTMIAGSGDLDLFDILALAAGLYVATSRF